MKTLTNKCSFCKFPITEEGIEMETATQTYHISCRNIADDFTSSVVGQLADIIRRTKRHCDRDGTAYELGDDISAMRFLLDLYERQDGVDPLTGLEMNCSTDHEYGFLLKPSLDRIDNSRGYEKNNVRFTTMWGNLQRNFLSDERFYRLCKAVVGTYEAKRRGRSSRKTINTRKA